MGLFKRLHRITIGRIEMFLDRVEDPEVLFPQLVKEMETQLRLATKQEASAVAAVKRAEYGVDANLKKIADLGRGAAQAIAVDDEDTAREALAAQMDTEKTLSLGQHNQQSLQATLDLATAARQQLQQQLAELRAKRSEILTRARVAKARKCIQRTVNGSIGSSGSILDSVARIEASIEEKEAELEIQMRLVGDSRVNPSLANRLAELDNNARIETRLDELRRQLVGAGDTD